MRCWSNGCVFWNTINNAGTQNMSHAFMTSCSGACWEVSPHTTTWYTKTYLLYIDGFSKSILYSVSCETLLSLNGLKFWISDTYSRHTARVFLDPVLLPFYENTLSLKHGLQLHLYADDTLLSCGGDSAQLAMELLILLLLLMHMCYICENWLSCVMWHFCVVKKLLSS